MTRVSEKEGHDSLDRERWEKRLDGLSTVLVSLALFITPLLFLPLTSDWFDLPKRTFLLGAGLLTAIILVLKSFLVKKASVFWSLFDLPVGLLFLACLISSLLASNRVVSLASDPVVYFSSGLVFFLLVQKIDSDKRLGHFLRVLTLLGVVLAIFALGQTILTLLGTTLAETLKITQPILATILGGNFSPTGSILTQTIFLAIVLPVAIGLAVTHRRVDKVAAVLVIIAGLVASVVSLLRVNVVTFSQDAGWKIATGTLGQTFLSAVFGIGPGNFVDAFTAFKPVAFNLTPFWNLRFTTGSNFYFYLLTTTGLVGLASFVLLTVRLLLVAKTRWENSQMTLLEKGLVASVVSALIIFLFLPAPQMGLFAFFVTLGLLGGHFRLIDNPSLVRETGVSFSPWKRPVLLVLLSAAFLIAMFSLVKFMVADYYYAQSLQAARQNRGTDTYNLQIKAIALNPYNDSYRATYSQTNLALADSLASRADLSDQQKQTVTTLVQQAIREGRNAVALAPRRAANWENLAGIYRGLINFAQGADQFAIASYNQAIVFEEANPRLRLDLGGIFFALKNYNSAVQAFTSAVNLKPDFANGHYNLAQAYKQLGQKDNAVAQLQLTASLVCLTSESQDCQKVRGEIADLGGSPATVSGEKREGRESEEKLATSSGRTSNLPRATITPPPAISSPSGEIVR